MIFPCIHVATIEKQAWPARIHPPAFISKQLSALKLGQVMHIISSVSIKLNQTLIALFIDVVHWFHVTCDVYHKYAHIIWDSSMSCIPFGRSVVCKNSDPENHVKNELRKWDLDSKHSQQHQYWSPQLAHSFLLGINHNLASWWKCSGHMQDWTGV